MAYQQRNMPPTDITFQLLEEITDGFSEEHKVGHGGFGEVYKGVHNGEEIAVKKLYNMQGLDDVQFKREFNNLMRVQHQNIIRLVGYCYEIRHKHIQHNGEFHFGQMVERALCFEYLEGGNLDKHISDDSCGLDWCTCYKIVKGICAGLNYLHKGSKDPIYHLDLKPANILLDKTMMPKIADFGLSQLFANTQTHTTKNFIGTPGYMPPEYINKHQISKKFDVFSLGVIIMQLLVGRMGYSESAEMPPQQFIDFVNEKWHRRVHSTSTPEVDGLELKTCIEIALRCVEADREKRPTITEIVDKLDEIDATKRTLIGQSSVSSECLSIDPFELRFPFELNKRISCVMQLANKTDGSIAFVVETNRNKYRTQPDKGIMKSWSRCYIIVTMQPQEIAPPNMRCNDLFLVRSRRVSENDDDDDDAKHFARIEMGKVVDEVRVPIVYVNNT